MTWDITWHSEDETVLILKPVDKYTWAEFQKAVEKAALMIGRKPYTVDVIYDLRNEIPVPGPGMLLQQREVHYRAPDNVGLTVLVGAGTFTRAVTRTVYRSLRNEGDLHFVETMEEAITIVETQEAGDE